MKQPQPLQPKNLTTQQKQAIQDRLRLNAQQVKEQEQINRERKMQDDMEATKNASRVAKSKAQYSHVQSKVGSTLPNSNNNYQQDEELPSYSQHTAGQDDVEITVYVRETEPDGGVQRMMESQLLRMNNDQQRQYDQNAMGAQGQQRRAGGGQQSGKNQYQVPVSQQRTTSQNAVKRTPLQTQQQPSVASNKPSAPQGHGKLGNVPDYLLQRKAELQAEKDAAARAIEEEKERNKNPPGHRAVSEEERQAVLAKLEARKLELERDLAKIPMRFDTIAVRNRRTEIEKEMSEVEEAHRRFSVRKQLFVPI